MKKVGGLLGATALSFGGLTALAPSAQADPLVRICITIEDKFVHVEILEVTILDLGPIGLNTTCIII